MATPFRRSLHALDADGFGPSHRALLLAGLLLAAWTVWFFFARITRYESTPTARLEVAGSAYPITAPVQGRVLEAPLALGQDVQAGDVLVALDTTAERLELREARARGDTLAARLTARRREVQAERAALGEARRSGGPAQREALARHEQAEALAELASGEAERARSLYEQGAIADVEWKRAEAAATERRAGAAALAEATQKLDADQRRQVREQEAQLAGLDGEIADLEGRIKETKALIERLEETIDLAIIRAPASGRVGEVALVKPGSMVFAGDRLGTLIPSGELQAIADFPPGSALGRIAIGQPATLRLDGFPWSQYGGVRATVTRVADEVRYGRVRVELEVHPDPTSHIPYQHGLPGTIEVEVERISPASLVLRLAGQALSRSSEPGARDAR